MPDVLSAEAIQERSGRGVEWETEVLFSELLASHEQLRGRLRESEIAVYDVLAQIEQLRGERDAAANAAENLRRAALWVGMWGESYHRHLADAVAAYENHALTRSAEAVQAGENAA